MSDSTTDACPECDGTYIYTRNGEGKGRMDDSAPTRFRCRGCGAEFDEPNRRTARRDANTLKGLAADLANASPEDVGP